MKKTILIVEDDEDDKDFLESCLKNAGVTNFISFSNAVSAINYLKNVSTTLPSLIITDSQLPGMSGLEFIKEVKSQDQAGQIKMISFTGGTTENNRQNLLNAGVNAVFVKPTNMDDYQEMVNNFITMANK